MSNMHTVLVVKKTLRKKKFADNTTLLRRKEINDSIAWQRERSVNFLNKEAPLHIPDWLPLPKETDMLTIHRYSYLAECTSLLYITEEESEAYWKTIALMRKQDSRDPMYDPEAAEIEIPNISALSAEEIFERFKAQAGIKDSRTFKEAVNGTEPSTPKEDPIGFWGPLVFITIVIGLIVAVVTH